MDMAEEVLHEITGCSEKAVGFPNKEYKIIYWEMNLTGIQLNDEICQISAFFPGEGGEFSQYIMPYHQTNPASQRHHNIKVVTVGQHRMLKHAQTGQVLKSRSEYSVFLDFLAWLEKSRGKDGVILTSYEPRKILPQKFIGSLNKHRLTNAFFAVVKGFANAFEMVQINLLSLRSKSLGSVVHSLLGKDKDIEIVTSLDRNRAVMELVKQMWKSDQTPDSSQGGGDDNQSRIADISAFVQEFSRTTEDERKSLEDQQHFLQRQDTFRPIFGPMVKKNRRDRQHARAQRQLMAETGLDYQTLLSVFQTDGPDGVAKSIINNLPATNANACKELIRLLVDHFESLTKTSAPSSDQNDKSKSVSNVASTLRNPAPSDLNSHSTCSQSAKSTSQGNIPAVNRKRQNNPGKKERAAAKMKNQLIVTKNSPMD